MKPFIFTFFPKFIPDLAFGTLAPRVGQTRAGSLWASLRYGLMLLLFGLCFACGQSKTAFRNTDLTGLDYAKNFALTDHNGMQRTLADFKGKAVVVFFGYTQCPDVCPTTLLELAQVMQQLGPLASKVQVLFITLDPERDTSAILAQYVPAFHRDFLALMGDTAAIAKTAKDFRVVHQKVPGKQPGSYTVDHTAASFVYDPQGQIRLFVRNGQGPEPMLHDLKLLLAGK